MICYIPMGFRCFYRSFNFSFIWSLKTCRFLMNLIKKRFRSATLKILFPQILQFLSYKRRHLELHLRILLAIKLWNVFIIHLHTTAVLRFFFNIPVNIKNECNRYSLFCNTKVSLQRAWEDSLNIYVIRCAIW